MRSDIRESGRAWWERGSPYRPFGLLVLCLGGAVLLLLSLQPPRGPSSPSYASATATPTGPATEHLDPPAPSRLSRRPRTAKPKPPPAAAATPSPKPRVPSIAEIEAEIVRLTNMERASRGLPVLTHDADLDTIARAHSRDMVARDFFSHENPSGDGPTERAERAGYDVHRPDHQGGELVGVAENIGMTPLGMVEDIGFVDREASSIAAAQVRGWMATRGHRSNILSREHERIGVGVTHNGTGAYICTQIFW